MALGYVPRWWMNGRGWTKSDAQAIRRHAIWWQSAYPATVVLGLPPVAFLGWEARLWQWTSSGHPPGIPGSVDLNVFLRQPRRPARTDNDHRWHDHRCPSVPAVPDAKRGKMLFLIKTQSRNEVVAHGLADEASHGVPGGRERGDRSVGGSWPADLDRGQQSAAHPER
jgi:hypothetical protein